MLGSFTVLAFSAEKKTGHGSTGEVQLWLFGDMNQHFVAFAELLYVSYDHVDSLFQCLLPSLFVRLEERISSDQALVLTDELV